MNRAIVAISAAAVLLLSGCSGAAVEQPVAAPAPATPAPTTTAAAAPTTSTLATPVGQASLSSRVSPPAFTTIVRKGGAASQLGAEATLGGWQMCSGLAHGRQWASFAFSDRDRVREMTSDVLEVRLTSSATTINIVTQCAFLLTFEARELFQRQWKAP
jgi:hypothetical protein